MCRRVRVGAEVGGLIGRSNLMMMLSVMHDLMVMNGSDRRSLSTEMEMVWRSACCTVSGGNGGSRCGLV